MSDAPFLDQFIQDFVHWLQTIDDCRAVILFGSASRGDHDIHSDRDIMVIATDYESQQYIDWVRDYAPIWVVIKEPTRRPLRGIVFKGGHKVHLSVQGVDDLQAIVDSGKLSMDFQTGYRVLLDKDNLASGLIPPYQPDYVPPSEAEFTDCIHNLVYGFFMLSKEIKRGNLWTVQWGNNIERNFLLQLLEWHAHLINPDVDTVNRGQKMQEWLRPDIWERLPQIMPQFDVEHSWQALFALMELSDELGKETANHLGYPYPQQMVDEVSDYIRALPDDSLD